MKYVPLFHISLRHAYYEDNCCPDIVIKADASGMRTLNKHRLSVISNIDGITVLAPFENGVPVTEVSKEEVFSFVMILQNKRFFHYTDMTKAGRAGVYENKGRGLELKLNTDLPGNLSAGVFGTIRLSNISSKETGREFYVQFSPRAVTWKYVLITDEVDAGAFSIEHAGLQDTKLEFKPAVKMKTGNTDVLLKLLEQDYPEANKLLLESRSEIPFLRTGRKNIQLKKDNLVLVDHLPNPRPEEGGIKVIKLFKK